MSATPGPWVHYDDSRNPQHRHMIAAMGKTIAHIYCTKGDEAADDANACLIAAAQDLLSALEGLMAIIDESRGVDGWHLNGDIAAWGEFEEPQIAEAAIAKAYGPDAQPK